MALPRRSAVVPTDARAPRDALDEKNRKPEDYHVGGRTSVGERPVPTVLTPDNLVAAAQDGELSRNSPCESPVGAAVEPEPHSV